MEMGSDTPHAAKTGHWYYQARLEWNLKVKGRLEGFVKNWEQQKSAETPQRKRRKKKIGLGSIVNALCSASRVKG